MVTERDERFGKLIAPAGTWPTSLAAKASICFNLSSNDVQEDISIPRRPTSKSLESLKVTLQQLEQTGDPGKDDASITELKRVLLNRIADLELSKTLLAQGDEIDEAPEPADLIPPSSITEEVVSEKEIRSTPLDKLD